MSEVLYIDPITIHQKRQKRLERVRKEGIIFTTQNKKHTWTKGGRVIQPDRVKRLSHDTQYGVCHLSPTVMTHGCLEQRNVSDEALGLQAYQNPGNPNRSCLE